MGMKNHFSKFLTATLALGTFSFADIPVEYLTPPSISEDHIGEKVTCIRPLRRECFNVSSEMKGDQLITHIYGHGGAGYALLPGSVNEGIRLFEDMLEQNPSYENKPICIVGAGCMGLMSAIKLKEMGYDVRVIAKGFDHLASNYAAGTSWFVSIKIIPEEKQKADVVAMQSWDAYVSVINGAHDFLSSKCASFMPVYCGLDTDHGLDTYIERGLVQPPEEVIIDFGNGKRHQVLKFNTIFINTTLVFQELQKKAKEMGIPVIQQEISSFEDLDACVVFNCTGLGAKSLNNDDKMVPVQGHLLMLKDQPPMDELQYMIYTEEHYEDGDAYVYYMPKSPGGVLGGTFIEHEGGYDTNSHEFGNIMKRGKDYFGAPSN
jgi:D-amino-acid oxidase